MRVVRTPAGAGSGALETAASEARKAFGDPSVYLEKFIQRPRHVEIQVLADQERTVHLGERECSIQRRHQKLVEEAPSVAVTPELREWMGAAAVAAAQAVGYLGAGTCEFLLARGPVVLLPRDEHPDPGRASRSPSWSTAWIWCGSSSASPRASRMRVPDRWLEPARLGDRVPDHQRGSGERVPAFHRPDRVPARSRRARGALGRRSGDRRRGHAVLRLAARASSSCGHPDRAEAIDRMARALDELVDRRSGDQPGIPPPAAGRCRVPRGRHRHPVPRPSHRSARALAERGAGRARSRSRPRSRRTRPAALRRPVVSGDGAAAAAHWLSQAQSWRDCGERGADSPARRRRRRRRTARGRAHGVRAADRAGRPRGARLGCASTAASPAPGSARVLEPCAGPGGAALSSLRGRRLRRLPAPAPRLVRSARGPPQLRGRRAPSHRKARRARPRARAGRPRTSSTAPRSRSPWTTADDGSACTRSTVPTRSSSWLAATSPDPS